MKKQVAFLMASMMTLSLVPATNSFAASTNDLERSVQNVPEKTMLAEYGYYTAKTTDTSDVKYVTDGNNLVLKLKNDIKAGDMFRIDLKNAKFFFRSNAEVSKPGDESYTSGAAIRAAYNLNGSTVSTEKFAGLSQTGKDSNYDPSKGTWVPDGSTSGTYVKYPTLDNYRSGLGYVLRVASDESATVEVLRYQFDYANAKISDFGNGSVVGGDGDKIIIPLVTRTTTDKGNIEVAVNGGNSTISNNNNIFATTNSTSTNTYVNDPQSARDKIAIDKLIIKENMTGAIKSSTTSRIGLGAPSGYYFSDLANVKVSAEPGLKLGSASVSRISDNELAITLNGLEASTNIPGSIYVTGLVLNAETNAAFGDITMSIKNENSSNKVVTEQTFKAGTRVDWAVGLKTDGTIPTLVSGRYDSNNSDKHKAAKVIFQETATESWWAGRETVFTVSDKAKIRRVDITAAENFTRGDIRHDGYTQDDNSKNSYVKIDGNKITLRDLEVEKSKKAKIEMNVFVSTEAGFAGDVTLGVSGTAVTNAMDPIVIAKAVNPVTVTSAVSNVKSGVQSVSSSDITLVEGGAGMLERDKDVVINFEDNNSYFSFLSGATVTVKDGDLKVKDVKTSGGAISFAIDSASSKASTIVISGVKVSVSGATPKVSVEPYKLSIGGKAIAANWNGYNNAKDQFATKGILVNYLQIGAGNVSVKIGDAIAKVGDKNVDMGVAPYIQNNSTMVPLRFIVEGLGYDVIWSDLSKDSKHLDQTVTIQMGDRLAQFKIGSSEVIVNGVKLPIQDLAGNTVKAEIKNGRTFLPFRCLGDILGVKVDWDEATKTATFSAK